MMEFDLLPVLNEGEEHIRLYDILLLRESALSEEEVWAMCLECCLAIQEVNSNDMFQALCITPESLAFDSTGAVSFLDLTRDPDALYIPPEYEVVGNSYKAHLFSLGLTMLFAAEFNAEDDGQPHLGEKLHTMIKRMTVEDYDKRVGLEQVIELCEHNLQGKSSQRLCREMASIAKLDSSGDTEDGAYTYPDDVTSRDVRPQEFTSVLAADDTSLAPVDLDHDFPRMQRDCQPPDAHVGGAITPPVAFRNSVEDYKRAIAHSPITNIPQVSPPKVSRMMALLDNGELKTVEMPSNSGSDSAGEDSKTPNVRTPSSATPNLSQKSSPVPAFDLGVSQNSAFQVVWSPRSSKSASPVIGQGQVPDKSPGASGLQALGDVRNVNYTTLLSATQTGSKSEAEVIDQTSVEDLNNKAKSKTETQLKSVRHKLDQLMAKYNQKLSPRLDQGRTNDAPLEVTASSPRTEEGSEVRSDSAASHAENDFEFGPSISPVPTFARGNSYSDSSAEEADDDEDEDGDGSESDGPERSPILKVSKLRLHSDLDNDFGTGQGDTALPEEESKWARLGKIIEGGEEEEEEMDECSGSSSNEDSEMDATSGSDVEDDISVSEDMEAEHEDFVRETFSEHKDFLRETSTEHKDFVRPSFSSGNDRDCPVSEDIVEAELTVPASTARSSSAAGHGRPGEMITGGRQVGYGQSPHDKSRHASPTVEAGAGRVEAGLVTGARGPSPSPHTATTTTTEPSGLNPPTPPPGVAITTTTTTTTHHVNSTSVQLTDTPSHTNPPQPSPIVSPENVQRTPKSSISLDPASRASPADRSHSGLCRSPLDNGSEDRDGEGRGGETGAADTTQREDEPDTTGGADSSEDGDSETSSLTGDTGLTSKVTTPASAVSSSVRATPSPASSDTEPGVIREHGEENTTEAGSVSGEHGRHTDNDKDCKEEDEGSVTEGMMSSRGVAPWGVPAENPAILGEPDRQAQTIQEMLEKLGCGFHENELWALCRECVNALHRYKYDLPAYVSLETVFLEESGEAGYQAVPEDRELEVVFLAPELQQHGIVTEKTCLFGIAAMLWSAADYKLPPNQEPALSEELENLLISMTQDNHELRPRPTDVLQVCSDYDRRHDVSSTKVCQALYGDAQKAEAFGKDNALVRDSIGEYIKEQQLSHQAQIVSCIKLSSELQAQLKPVSARQLAAKPVVRSLHDKLMDEIFNPTKKLRKSSRPKVMSVRDIFINNPDLMSKLKRVTQQPHAYENSAFIANGYGGAAPPRTTRPMNCQSAMPNAYKSPATHFTPIVLSPNGQTGLHSDKPKSQLISDGLNAETDRKVARKLKEMKKNLFKNRAPLNIAQDLENEDRLDRTMGGQRSHLANLTEGQGQSKSPFMGSPPAGVPQMSPLWMANNQGTLGQGTLGQGTLGQGTLGQGTLGQGTLGQGTGGVHSPPINPAGNILPFQLQHDPRTGLFQLVPVQVPVQMQVQMQQQQQLQQPQPGFLGNQTPPTLYNGASPNQVLQQNGKADSEELLQRIQSESEERRRYLKYTQELRSRVKTEGPENDRLYQQPHRTRSSATGSRSADKRSEGKVKTRSSRDKDGQRRSHTVSGSDLAKPDLAKATNNVRNRAKEIKSSRSGRSDLPGLKKSSSDENILEKVQQSNNAMAARIQGSEDLRTRLKRAKSGSSLDYRNVDLKVKDIPADRYVTSGHPGHFISNNNSSKQLSKSNPNLDLDLPQDDVRRSREAPRRSRTGHAHDESHVRSPEVGVSPPPSPSLSKDSGVSGLNLKASGELSLMERLLNSDTVRHQQRLSKVIRLLRDEFAFDSYMENGVEDLAMAEYVLSMANLKWETFNNAVTEKYCDLFWQDELLTGLYEAVNGTRPVIEKRIPTNHGGIDKMSNGQSRIPSKGDQKGPITMATRQSPARTANHIGPLSQSKPSNTNLPNKHGHSQSHVTWNGTDVHPMNRENFTGSSAFRPIRNSVGEKPLSSHHDSPVYKPKPVKVAGSHTDTSDSTDNEVSHRPRRFRKKNQLEKGKSSSMHDLFLEKAEQEAEESPLTKSHSQGNLMKDGHEVSGQEMDPHHVTNHVGGHHHHQHHHQQQHHHYQQHPNRQHMGIAVSMDGNKPKVVYIRSSESENDSYESNTNATYQGDDHTPRGRHLRAMANMTAGYRNNNSYVYRYDSDSSSTGEQKNSNTHHANTLPFQRQNASRLAPSRSRDDSQSESSRGSGQSVGRRITPAKSDGYLNVLSSGDEYGSHERLHPGGQRRLFRGSVVYYAAEMEFVMRPEIRDFAMQVWSQRKKLVKDTRTKESIETKMTELDQQMMVEHRQKRKTVRFYQKLADACRSGKGADQKGMLGKVSKQLMEMNTKLEFLDSAKKHLEMLYAEQWGLDHYLLYSLAKCPPDQPMLLAPCENPTLQYQTVKGTLGAGDGLVLQAGLPDGLMAYQFAQHALSEGYIHQFFYCFRYFVTPGEFLGFIMDKFEAAALSLSPEAAVPAKVKARSLDLIQVWVEGYYSIDFKHNPELTQVLYDFIKDKMLPMEPSAEYLLELLEDAQDDRHIDLHYPQFSHSDDPELQLVVTDTPPKKVKRGQTPEVTQLFVAAQVGLNGQMWESFKAALHLSAKPVKMRPPVRTHLSMASERYPSSPDIDKCDHDAYFPRSPTSPGLGPSGRFETFGLGDYTTQTLAEQLTLMEQDLFRQSHPVHYLNSKAQGVGVALTTPAINKAQSMYRLTAAWEDNQESSLFVGTFTTDDIIQRMIEHSQAISFWAAAEVVCCSTSKAQMAAISKLLCIGRLCYEMRNYATCISILDGLENVLVRQVPAWRSLPSKYVTIMEELASVRVFLKTDPLCLLQQGGYGVPTIPCVLLFLLHVQQMEIGGFRLANTMYKWTKMKAICKVIDQIRIFKERSYVYEADRDLHDMIRQRMRDLGQQDLHVLAAQHDANFQKVASRMPGIFKRMKGKMGKSVEA